MSLYEDAGPTEIGLKASWLANEMRRAGLDVDAYELHLALAKAIDRSPFVVVREKELLMEHIAGVVAEYGDPAQHAHHYRRRTRHRKDRT